MRTQAGKEWLTRAVSTSVGWDGRFKRYTSLHSTRSGGLDEDELSAERGGLPIKTILPTWCTM